MTVLPYYISPLAALKVSNQIISFFFFFDDTATQARAMSSWSLTQELTSDFLTVCFLLGRVVTVMSLDYRWSLFQNSLLALRIHSICYRTQPVCTYTEPIVSVWAQRFGYVRAVGKEKHTLYDCLGMDDVKKIIANRYIDTFCITIFFLSINRRKRIDFY